MFNRTEFETKLEIIESKIPSINILDVALQKMKIYVDECPDEIGWLGVASREGSLVTIRDVILFDQDVHATTTEITPEGLSQFAEELVKEEGGVELWNNIKVWGHSHVNMSTSPSGQDDSQMEVFEDSGHEWFVRIIANKKGELVADFYDFETGICYIDTPWNIEYTGEAKRINDRIEELYRYIEEETNKLYDELDSHEKEFLEEETKNIKKEMKEKVRKKTYGTAKVKVGKRKPWGMRGVNYGSEHYDLYYGYGQYNYYSSENMFQSDDEVRPYFGELDFESLKDVKGIVELEETLLELGYHEIYTSDDLERVFRVILKSKGGL